MSGTVSVIEGRSVCLGGGKLEEVDESWMKLFCSGVNKKFIG